MKSSKQKFLIVFIIASILLALFVLLGDKKYRLSDQNQQVGTTTKKPNATYKAPDGKTIIKNALPPSLKQIEADIKNINQDLNKDFIELEVADKLALSKEVGVAENNIQEAEKILALAAKDGVNNNVIETEFNQIIDAPITAEKPLEIKKQLDGIDRDVIDIEEEMINLALDKQIDNTTTTNTTTNTTENSNED